MDQPDSVLDPVLDSAIDRFVAAERGGLLLDFDGTIAAIQGDPESVSAHPEVLTEIRRAAELVSVVAVISGRNAAFLRARLQGTSGLRLFGMYGLEQVEPDGAVLLHPQAEQWLPTMRRLRERASAELPAEVYVEDKQLAVALHYRRASQHRQAVESWAAERATALGVAVQPGRMVVELKPPVDRNKGHVVRESIQRLGAAWYFGDDLGDLAAFDALRERQQADPGFAALAVAVANDAGVSELTERAQLVLPSPDAVAGVLHRLNNALAG